MENKKNRFSLKLKLTMIIIIISIVISISFILLENYNSNSYSETKKGLLNQTFTPPKINFDISPGYYSIKHGKSVKISVGVKNNDSIVHSYKINVFPANADDTTLEFFCNSGSSFEYCDYLKEEMKIWITNLNEQQRCIYEIQPDRFKIWNLEFAIPDNAVKGQYQYKIFACMDEETENGCNSSNAVWAPNFFTLEIR